MPHGSITEVIPAPSEKVFHLLHDYERRLEWDSLLRRAFLVDGGEARLGTESYCQARWRLGGIGIAARYVSFQPPRLAAVKMVNRPPFFATFAATIRHRDLSESSSIVEYKYRFIARPAFLRFLLHPVMQAILAFETRKRLRSLRRYFEENRHCPAVFTC